MSVAVHTRRRTSVKPDPQKVKDQLQGLQALRANYGDETFLRYMFWILRKNPEPGETRKDLPPGAWNKRLIPFSANRVQLDIIRRAMKRNICLKSRQGGYTTLMILWRLYLNAVLEAGSGCLLVSQNNKKTGEHFLILMRAHKYFGAVDPYDRGANDLNIELHQHLLHTAYSSRRELIFDMLDSRILCDSAEVEEAGQGITTNHAVCTEVARWPGNPEETLANLKESIPHDGTLDIESTANGLGGYFYQECMRARDPMIREKEFNYFFHEWWWFDDYRAEKEPNIKEAPLTSEELALREKFHLDLYQIQWRREKKISLRHNFAEKYPEDDLTCFLVSGLTFFDRDILAARYLELRNYQPLYSHRGGELRVFFDRQRGRQYVIGVDVAEGKQVGDGADYNAAVVYDLETGLEMAAYRSQVTPAELAYDIAELGRHYNNALVAVERNGPGGATLITLDNQCQYGRIYMHREWIRKDKQAVEFPGFPTNTKTRPIALNRLRQELRESPNLYHDVQFLSEAMNFVRDEKGKPAGAEGTHDDTVMARAIATYARMVALGYLDPTKGHKESYDDRGEDSENAA